MTRRIGLLALGLGFASLAAAIAVRRLGIAGPPIGGLPAAAVAGKLLLTASVVLLISGAYRLLAGAVVRRTASKRRAQTARNVLRLVFTALAAVGVLAVVTEQWIGLLFSLGVFGVAVTFALQQPLFSLIGWLYIVAKRPYQVGDRVAIEGTRGDVVSIDFFVTEVWEIDGDLVSTNQPSGRIVTVPNSVVLSSHVVNFYGEGVPYVWNELSLQVAYETDLAFATDLMVAVADEHLGDEMARQVEEYRHRLGETPVELDVQDRPTVNVVQQESWVELRLRYLVHPRRGTRARNAMYRAILERCNEHPDRVKFPVSRNR